MKLYDLPRGKIMRSRGPLFLFTSPDVNTIFDRQRIERIRKEQGLARLAMNPFLAKTLSPTTTVLVGDDRGDMVRVLDSPYNPRHKGPLYTIRALLEPVTEPKAGQLSISKAQILTRLQERVGTPYLYGGGSVEGSSDLRSWLMSRGFFSEPDLLDSELRQLIHLNGLDCSSLLIDAMNHTVQFDTQHVWDFAQSMGGELISSIDVIAPLDIMVWKGREGGHMVIVLNEKEVIHACGIGETADTFLHFSGHKNDSSYTALDRYNKVTIDSLEVIIAALERGMRKSLAHTWAYGDITAYNIVRILSK